MDKKQCRKYIVPVILTALVCLFLFTRPEICSEGVRSGILLAAETVVPSLFPFMTVASFLLRSGLGEAAGKPFDKVCEKLFRLPGVLAPVIIMSQIGGFPIGAKMTYELLKKNAITENEAQRACLFCINAGPAFVIGTVGSEMLGSVKAGVLLYISTVSASFFTGIFSMALYDKAAEEKGKSEIPVTLCDPVGAFVRSVGDATNDVIKICAWVVIFKTVCDGLSTLPIPPGAALFFEFILEVTNGCRAAAGKAPIPALAAIISFGGLSVHCQIMSYQIHKAQNAVFLHGKSGMRVFFGNNMYGAFKGLPMRGICLCNRQLRNSGSLFGFRTGSCGTTYNERAAHLRG